VLLPTFANWDRSTLPPGASLPHRAADPVTTVQGMPEDFDVDAMVVRFKERAAAVRKRGIPPLEGDDRKRFMQRMQLDYMDYAMLGDATGSLEDGILTLRIDLRPKSEG
jgi:hypothetical protein